METTHLIVSCTDRKRADVSTCLHLRGVADGEPSRRLSAWWDLLRNTGVERVQARGLYGGEHWTWSLRALEVLEARRGRARLWIASAGYGLVSVDALLKPYSATFASNADDDVARLPPPGWTRPTFLQSWWQGLSKYKGPAPGDPRSISEIAQSDPKAAILVVASPTYVQSLGPDLERAASSLSRPTRLVLFSNHRLQGSPLAHSLVPIDERARARVGGTMQGLNARVAAVLLGDLNGHAVDAEQLRARFEQMVEHTAKPTKPNRPQIDDDVVIAFIRAELAKNPNARQTALLAELRRSGRACEQGRFRRLFQQHGAK